MKNFIDSFTRILINTIIIALILAICFIAFVFLLTKTSDITITDSISYIKTLGNKTTSSDYKTTSSEQIYYASDNNKSQIDINSNNKNNKFFYSQLDDIENIIYDALENNIDGLKKLNYVIDFSTQFDDLLHYSNGQEVLDIAFQSAIDGFFYDHPELFYVDLTKFSLKLEYTTLGPFTRYTVAIEPFDGISYLTDAFSSEESVNKAISEVESIKDKVIKDFSSKDDYTKALKVHDMLVSSIKYSESPRNSHNIYGALIEKQVVCEGYAKAFKYLMDSLDVECILVSGTATNSSGKTESHMWNYIKLNKKWYGVDVTWDDPIIIGGYSDNNIRHDYFCKGSNLFNKSHVIDNNISDTGNAFSFPELSYQNYK